MLRGDKKAHKLAAEIERISEEVQFLDEMLHNVQMEYSVYQQEFQTISEGEEKILVSFFYFFIFICFTTHHFCTNEIN